MGKRSLKIKLLINSMVAICLYAHPVSAEASDPKTKGVKYLLSDYAKNHDLNGTILVEQKGSVIYKNSFGFSDRTFDIPARNDTRYRIMSLTKTFTSTIILQLFEEGKLKLDDNILTYLPDFHGEGARQITVQNLLNHTSGLPQFDVAKTREDGNRLGLPMYERLQSSGQIVKRYCTGKAVHLPGETFDYNNCDYIVLGQIIERITQLKYDEALRQRILIPVGMADSGVKYQKDIVKNLANSYYRLAPSGQVFNDMPLYNENLSAAGAMYSTAGDIMKFANALFNGRLLNSATLKLMLTPGLGEYGDGIWIRTFGPQKTRLIERYGKSSGMNILLSVFPEQDTTIIIISNTSDLDVTGLRNKIAQAIIK